MTAMLHLLAAHPHTRTRALVVLTDHLAGTLPPFRRGGPDPAVLTLLRRHDLPSTCADQLLHAHTRAPLSFDLTPTSNTPAYLANAHPDALAEVLLLWGARPGDKSDVAHALVARRLDPSSALWATVLSWDIDDDAAHAIAGQMAPWSAKDLTTLLRLVDLADARPTTRQALQRRETLVNPLLRTMLRALDDPTADVGATITALHRNPPDTMTCTFLVRARHHIPQLALRLANAPHLPAAVAAVLAQHPRTPTSAAHTLLAHALTPARPGLTSLNDTVNATSSLIVHPACPPAVVNAHQRQAQWRHLPQLMSHLHPDVADAYLRSITQPHAPRTVLPTLATHPNLTDGQRTRARREYQRTEHWHRDDLDPNFPHIVAASTALPDVDAAAAHVHLPGHDPTTPRWSDPLTTAWLTHHWGTLDDDTQVAAIHLARTGATLTLPDWLDAATALAH